MPSLDAPSDLFFAIGDALLAAIPGIDIGNYDEFDECVSDATVLIEFEHTAPAVRDNSGRYAHEFHITLHAVVGRWRQYAVLEAVNLASLIERAVDTNCWRLPGDRIELPRDLRAAPSIFKKGRDGFEAWGVSFSQTIYLGPSLLDEDPVTVAGPHIANAWEVDADNPATYDALEYEEDEEDACER